MTYASDRPSFRMPAYGAVFIDKNIEDGDKIILHPDVLEHFMKKFGAQAIPHPLIFEISNMKMGTQHRISHCGVLEFSAPNRKAYLPTWMMHNLNVVDSDAVTIKLIVDIPKATKVVFQPLHYDFTKMPSPKQTLEYALRKFTALTVGDTILILHGSDRHLLNVKELEPKGKHNPVVGCVINTIVAVEFETPLEKALESEQVQEIEIGKPVNKSIGGDRYAYFRVRILAPTMALLITTPSSQGEPDLYISTKTNQPSTTQYEWKRTHKNNQMIIDPRHPNFQATGWYYIAVHAYKNQATFDLLVEEIPPPDEQKQVTTTGQTTGNVTAPDAKKCDNCWAMIGPKQWQMHTLQCSRNNWRCSICGQVMRKSEQSNHIHCPTCNIPLHKDELEKHIDLTHATFVCRCGASLELSTKEHHLANLCPLRLMSCQFCDVHMPMKELHEHQNYCGSKTNPCSICGKSIARKRLDVHMAVEHSVNPSLRPDEKSSLGIAGTYANGPKKSTNIVTARHLYDAAADAASTLGASTMEAARAAGMSADDLALQQALMASQGYGQTSSLTPLTPHSMEEMALSHALKNTKIEHKATMDPSHYDEDDTFNDDAGDDGDDGDDGGDDWDDTPAPTKKASTAYTECPYCEQRVLEKELESHMEQLHKDDD